MKVLNLLPMLSSGNKMLDFVVVLLLGAAAIAITVAVIRRRV